MVPSTTTPTPAAPTARRGVVIGGARRGRGRSSMRWRQRRSAWNRRLAQTVSLVPTRIRRWHWTRGIVIELQRLCEVRCDHLHDSAYGRWL